MSNGATDPWHQAIPGWAKTAAFLIGTIGFPICTAGYFMAKDVGVFSSPQARNEATLARMENSLAEAIRDMKGAVQQRDTTMEKLLHVQVQTCRNAARTEQQTRDCDYWRR